MNFYKSNKRNIGYIFLFPEKLKEKKNINDIFLYIKRYKPKSIGIYRRGIGLAIIDLIKYNYPKVNIEEF